MLNKFKKVIIIIFSKSKKEKGIRKTITKTKMKS